MPGMKAVEPGPIEIEHGVEADRFALAAKRPDRLPVVFPDFLDDRAGSAERGYLVDCELHQLP